MVLAVGVNMLEIAKQKTEHGYFFLISTNEGKFSISFQGNLDLYWSYLYDRSIVETSNFKSFVVTKENYFLYSLFEKLYDDIKHCNIYQFDKSYVSLYESEEEIEARRLELENLNNSLRESEGYNSERLFKNDAIEWHCDDFPYEEASVLRIKKEEDSFVVTFEKSKEENMYLTYSVRFRNSGSRYNPFNSAFMKMYNKLIDYDPEYHQIHVEEYLYQKKLSRK